MSAPAPRTVTPVYTPGDRVIAPATPGHHHPVKRAGGPGVVIEGSAMFNLHRVRLDGAGDDWLVYRTEELQRDYRTDQLRREPTV